MIKFLFKGIIRDRGRSLFPFLTVTIGVLLTVFAYSYIKGGEYVITRVNANLHTGHLKVMTRAYAREADQGPNDAALLGVGALIQDLAEKYPSYDWAARIRFGGLLDVPDAKGETLTQGPAFGFAADIITPGSQELERLALAKGLQKGRLPSQAGEILVSDDFAVKLGVGPGDKVTLISATAAGSMATANFVVSGTVRFGAAALDRMGFVVDLEDARAVLDMEDAAGEVLGFFKNSVFRKERAEETARSFNALYSGEEDDFAPTMIILTDQSGLGAYLNLLGSVQSIIILIFLLPMSLVLWNAGLLGSLRRYGEMGVRLAIGEDKGHVYRTLLVESLMVGVLGTVTGTALGLALSYYIQAKGIDITALVKNASILMPSVIYAKVTPVSYFIGFIPGLAATFIGTAISGREIYKRQTAHLFKELET
jgi:putative ABC transport system permease protein